MQGFKNSQIQSYQLLLQIPVPCGNHNWCYLSQEVALAGIFLRSLWPNKTKKSISWVLDVLRSCFELENDSKL